MLFSKGCTYAIRAALLVTLKEQQDGRKFTPIRELAEELDLSFHFLTKIMQLLTEAGVLASFRGPTGGVGLAKKACKIMILDVVAAVDGMDLFTQCALGLPDCGESAPCPLHDVWSKRREDLRQMLADTSLETLAMQIHSDGLRT